MPKVVATLSGNGNTFNIELCYGPHSDIKCFEQAYATIRDEITVFISRGFSAGQIFHYLSDGSLCDQNNTTSPTGE